MSRYDRFGIEICRGLRRFRRMHMDVLPVLVVLPVLHNGQINAAKLLADRFEVRAVTGVAAVVDLPLRGDKHKAAPQGLVTLNAASGKVARWQHMHRQRIADVHRLVPVPFINNVLAHPPVAQV